MKFLLDHNLPPALARALNELSKADGHNVYPLRDRFAPETSDQCWIRVLKAEGDWIVISQDRFIKGDTERQAFRTSGIPVFCLARQWAAETYWSKAHNLIRWWPAIVQQSSLIKGGAGFKISWRYSPPGKFEQLKI